MNNLSKNIVFGGFAKTSAKKIKKFSPPKRQTYIPPASNQGAEEISRAKFKSFKNSFVKYGMKIVDMSPSFYRAGSTSVAITSVVNQAVLTTLKGMHLQSEGDSKYYDEKLKMYLKPHFALPSRWDQPRITFGTPWYF